MTVPTKYKKYYDYLKRSPSLGFFFLAIIVAFYPFKKVFIHKWILFSNDGPLGAGMSHHTWPLAGIGQPLWWKLLERGPLALLFFLFIVIMLELQPPKWFIEMIIGIGAFGFIAFSTFAIISFYAD